MHSDVLVWLGHLMHGNAPRVIDFGGGSVYGQSRLKFTGRYGKLCCQSLRWGMVVFGTLPLSTGQVGGATGEAQRQAVSFLAALIVSLTCPIFT